MNQLYTTISGLCNERGITIGKMAKEAGISPSLFSEIKAGRSTGLTIKTASKLANYFNVPVSTFMPDSEQVDIVTEMQDELFDKRKLLFDISRKATEQELDTMIKIANAIVGDKRWSSFAIWVFSWLYVALQFLIYTGFRIREFLDLKTADCSADYLKGGMKTESSKNRIVPVHPVIKEYIQGFIEQGNKYVITENGAKIEYSHFLNHYFVPLMEELNIRYPNGKMLTPHSTRHIFASLCYEYKVETLAMKKMLGHSVGSGITEQVYIHITPEQLSEEINKIC